MKRSQFSEEHIIGILRERESGANIADVCRKRATSAQRPFLKWKAKYRGLDVWTRPG